MNLITGITRSLLFDVEQVQNSGYRWDIFFQIVKMLIVPIGLLKNTNQTVFTIAIFTRKILDMLTK